MIMSENKSDALALNFAAFGVMEAALKIEMELAGGLGIKGKMALAYNCGRFTPKSMNSLYWPVSRR
jgi:hypothetical protein